MKNTKKLIIILLIMTVILQPINAKAYSENAYIASCVLGSVGDPSSVAWLLQKILNYMRALAPMIVVVMSGIDFTKVIISGDDDGLKKAQKKLIYRLLLIMALFFVPVIVDVLLDLFGLSNATCGIR